MDFVSLMNVWLKPIALAAGTVFVLLVIVLTVIEQRDRRRRRYEAWFAKRPRHHTSRNGV